MVPHDNISSHMTTFAPHYNISSRWFDLIPHNNISSHAHDKIYIYVGWNVIIWDQMFSSGAKVIMWGKYYHAEALVIIWDEMLSGFCFPHFAQIDPTSFSTYTIMLPGRKFVASFVEHRRELKENPLLFRTYNLN